jgi:hypothetical protein
MSNNTLFDARSPSGRNDAKLYLNSKGQLFDRFGRHWGRSSMRMAQDAALATPMSTGPKKPMNWHASAARNDLNAALKKLSDVLGLPEEVADRIGTIIEDAEREAIQEYAASLGGGAGKRTGSTDKGKGALDKTKGAAARDDDDDDRDDDDFAARVRSFLKGKGLDDRSVEQAVEIAVRNRAAGIDERPENHLDGGPPIRGRVWADADLEKLIDGYPDEVNLGRLDPDRGTPGYRPSVREASEMAMRRVAGAGTGIRLKTPSHTPTGDEVLAYPDYVPDPDRFSPPRGLAGDAVLEASDAEMEKSYPGFGAVKAGVW